MARVKHIVFSAALAFGGLSGSVAAEKPEGTFRLDPAENLSAMLDCFEKAERTLISAHRGGPSPGLPENAIETMDAFLAAVPAIMEIDIARSADGIHYLMHDRTLDRTTTGSGNVDAPDWETIRTFYLVDEAGWVTPYKVPSLSAALSWARDKTILQLDFKQSANVEEVVDQVRDASMEDRVILIAYTLEQAKSLYQLAPDMLISYSMEDLADLEAATAAGIPAERIVAFTGTQLPRPDLYRALDEQNVEVIFGTLGRSPNSIDSIIDRFGTDERYVELAEGGVDILATDRGRAAAKVLAEAGRLPQSGQCGVGGAQ